ncbi:hypothetical protein ABIB75_002573 [Bradyrhizobium sp. GM2.2]|nr:hypothetical protein [Bradyrhizobium canariense]
MTAKAPHRQYTGFQKPAMAFFAHPLKVRLSYFNCVDYKPHFAPETAVCRIRLPKGRCGMRRQIMAMPPLTWMVWPVT